MNYNLTKFTKIPYYRSLHLHGLTIPFYWSLHLHGLIIPYYRSPLYELDAGHASVVDESDAGEPRLVFLQDYLYRRLLTLTHNVHTPVLQIRQITHRFDDPLLPPTLQTPAFLKPQIHSKFIIYLLLPPSSVQLISLLTSSLLPSILFN